ncbi:amino acid adenylation domain-containing protein [Rubrivivax benzoatilyticus]|uniref:Amino acid adenylation domain-containing protein n=3 Tax=Rubrivivax benzoatilyticus TaxID=316997 RepID=A0ABX0I0N2_9BURK|nr:amino acid adenylation domain-containing protein [Rubrivivax benzoatilyticus]NHK99401.1 amino acid adenylation domain-containing protein [Rubrivivax benzoatilyticus]NHL25275.1 amino acid adenylation domain-containing protein [Rubrivivax benzoatilyticus]
MAEPGRGLDALADSAPPRDFVRDTAPGTRPVEAALGPATTAARPARLLAAAAALLALHARRETVTLALQRSGRRRLLTLDTAPATPFGALVAAAAAALAADDDAVPALPAALPGVLLDLDDDGAAAADLVLQPAAGRLRADASLYRANSLPPLARQLEHRLAATGDDAVALADLAWFDAAERERLLRGFNTLRLDVPATTLAALVDARAAQAPGAVCAVHGERTLDRRTLQARANRLARRLVALGVGPGSFVPIVVRRGLDFAVAMLAVWKAGGAYVPVDPGYPEQRVRLMLEDCDAAVAVVGAAALARYGAALAACPALRHVVCQREAAAPPGAGYTLHGPQALQAEDDAPLPPRAGPHDAAYMVYTSGSTGRPKGAIVRHDGAVNHLFAQAHALGEAAVARFLQSAPSSSDISVWQFAAPLAFGGCCVVLDDATDVAALLQAVRRHRLQLVELVPAVLKYLCEYAAALPEAERALPSLRWMMVTGESAPVALVNAWLALYPGVPVVNAYGPTEAADDVAQAVLAAPLPPRQASVSIGRPLANLDLYVLDERLRPLPVGAPGELCVAGVGVGAGYWRQPEKTAAAFVPNPFDGAAGPVIYRTGDLARWRDDGTLECGGRLDHQVQIRGQRIELAEIEAQLRRHPALADVVVQAFHDGEGDGRLVAFVVARAEADDAALRAHLAARLPAAMLPAAFVRLDALPLNPAGKVDRRALRPPAAPAALRSAGRAPASALEALLARLWAEELGRPAVGVDEDFFALGGDSLAALAIAVGAREAGWTIRSADVLAHPSVERLAAAMSAAASAPAARGDGPPEPAGVLRPLADAERAAFLAAHPHWADVQPLTPAQQGLYVHWLLARDKRAYVDQLVYELDGELDPAAFAAAWNAVVARHPALRAGFLRSALSQPVQVVARALAVPVELLDLTALDAAAQDGAWREHCRREVDTGFDLTRPPLMRLLLARLAPGRHRLAWTHHHLLLDGWSLALVLDELLARLAGRAPDDAPAVTDEALRAHLAAAEPGPGLAWWREALAGVLPAPAWDAEPPPGAAPGYHELDLVLPAGTGTALAAAAAAFGVTPTTLLQAAWAVTVARHTGRDDVVFGVVSTGRELPVPRLGELVGLCVVTQPLRVAAGAGTPLAAWLAALQRRAAEARAHEAVPLAQLVRTLALPPGRPLMETLFVMSNYPAPATAAGPLLLRPAALRTVPAYPLSLVVLPGDGAALRLVHDGQRFDPEAAAAIGTTLLQAVQRLAGGEDPR